MIKCGRWVTKAGFAARVARLRSIGLEWRWEGAIECPATGVLVMTSWHANGDSTHSPDLTLVSREKEEELEERSR